jgi:hypothetical protein
MNNEFPINVFPPLFKDLIMDCNKSLNFPIDYTGTAILTAISTAIGTSAKVKVKEGWYEYASLYTAIVGKAGANKSHPISLIFDVFNQIDKKAIDEFTPLYHKFIEYQRLSNKERKESTPIKEPQLSKTVLGDFTPEMLLQRLSTNKKGCVIVSDELATFIDGMNNYSKGDRASLYLTLWSNKATSVDRVGKPIPIMVTQPFLNVIGGIQPRVLPKLFPSNKIDNGFLQRFLFAYPNYTGKKSVNKNEKDEELIKAFNGFILDYINNHPVNIDATTGNATSKIYHFSNEAKEYFFNWSEGNADEVNNNSETVIGEILSKFDNHFIRFALLLQIMENDNAIEIGLNAVKGAERLCEYFTNCAVKVIDTINEPPKPSEDLPQNKFKLYNELSDVEFSTGTAVRLAQKVDINMKERTVKAFLMNRTYFDRIGYGVYKRKL